MAASLGFRAFLLAAVPTGLMLAAALPASAQGLTQFSLYRSNENQQTGPSTIIPFNGGTNYFFTSSGFESSASDFDAMTTTAPTGVIYSHGAATVDNGGLISMDYQTGYLTKSDLDTTYPAGAYTLNATNSGTGGAVSVTQTYDGTDHYVAPPQLTAATFNALNGLNPANAFTFSFLPFTPDPATNVNGTFLDIVDVNTLAVAFNDSVFDPSVTSFTVPANALLPSEQYVEELVFSSRIDSAPPVGACTTNGPTCPGNLELSWDSRTLTIFTTGAAVPTPEPASLALFGVGLLGLGVLTRRRKIA